MSISISLFDKRVFGAESGRTAAQTRELATRNADSCVVVIVRRFSHDTEHSTATATSDVGVSRDAAAAAAALDANRRRRASTRCIVREPERED